jgi:2-polyprenyl-6-hydroxyphenyl methylase/3-demethylubiquinone-9 3-methyltransferase
MIGTATPSGLHDFVFKFIADTSRTRGRALDLGAGPGAMSERLHSLGFNVLAVDRDAAVYQGTQKFFTQDLNDPHFSAPIGPASFDLIVSVEVIEHIESPINFLRNIGLLLAPGGRAVITTPNVDSLPARLRFLFGGKIRMMDDYSDPTHISPIFMDLLRRQFLPQAHLRLAEHRVFPPKGYNLTRQPMASLLALLAPAFSGDSVLGDNHMFVLEPAV